MTAAKVLLTRICFLSSDQDIEVESRSHFAIVNAKTAAPTVCVSQNSLYGTTCSVQGYSATSGLWIPVVSNSSKNLFCYWCFCLSCWFWVRRIRSLKRWIGLSRNSPVWDQTHQVTKVVRFLLLHLCQKQMKTESKKILWDFEVASSSKFNLPII